MRTSSGGERERQRDAGRRHRHRLGFELRATRKASATGAATTSAGVTTPSSGEPPTETAIAIGGVRVLRLRSDSLRSSAGYCGEAAKADRGPRDEREHERDADRSGRRPCQRRVAASQISKRPQEHFEDHRRTDGHGRRRRPRRVAIAPDASATSSARTRADRPVLDVLERGRIQKRDRVAAPVAHVEHEKRPDDTPDEKKRYENADGRGPGDGIRERRRWNQHDGQHGRIGIWRRRVLADVVRVDVRAVPGRTPPRRREEDREVERHLEAPERAERVRPQRVVVPAVRHRSRTPAESGIAAASTHAPITALRRPGALATNA